MLRTWAAVLLLCLAGCASQAPTQPASKPDTPATAAPATAAPESARTAPTTAGQPQAAPAPLPPYGPTDSAQNTLAPWSVRQTRLADNRWLISMRKALFSMGGDGESAALLHQHAQRLAQQQGYSEYVILNFTEGVQSDLPLPYRWARGEIVLKSALPPMPKS